MAIKSYKGFDKNLRCRDFQYKIGGIYEMERAFKCGDFVCIEVGKLSYDMTFLKMED